MSQMNTTAQKQLSLQLIVHQCWTLSVRQAMKKFLIIHLGNAVHPMIAFVRW